MPDNPNDDAAAGAGLEGGRRYSDRAGRTERCVEAIPRIGDKLLATAALRHPTRGPRPLASDRFRIERPLSDSDAVPARRPLRTGTPHGYPPIVLSRLRSGLRSDAHVIARKRFPPDEPRKTGIRSVRTARWAAPRGGLSIVDTCLLAHVRRHAHMIAGSRLAPHEALKTGVGTVSAISCAHERLPDATGVAAATVNLRARPACTAAGGARRRRRRRLARAARAAAEGRGAVPATAAPRSRAAERLRSGRATGAEGRIHIHKRRNPKAWDRIEPGHLGFAAAAFAAAKRSGAVPTTGVGGGKRRLYGKEQERQYEPRAHVSSVHDFHPLWLSGPSRRRIASSSVPRRSTRRPSPLLPYNHQRRRRESGSALILDICARNNLPELAFSDRLSRSEARPQRRLRGDAVARPGFR